MQRLPYNGARRAHKLRHNVTSSSLFNERWQRALRTRSYPRVFVVRLCLSLSLFSLLDTGPTINAVRHRCPPRELVASRALRCQVGLKRNPPTYRSRAGHPYPEIVFRGSRYHFLGALPRYRALPIIISLLPARYASPVTAAFVFAITRWSFVYYATGYRSLWITALDCAISCNGNSTPISSAYLGVKLGADLPRFRQ